MGIKAGSGKGSGDASGTRTGGSPIGIGSGGRRRKTPIPQGPADPKKPLKPAEPPFPQKPEFRLGHYVILEERDDYVICEGFDPNAKYPFTEITPTAFRTINVAKPPVLQRTSWEAGPVDIGGTLYTYAYSDEEFGVRTATWTDSNGDDQEEEQRIDLPYILGDLLVAVEIRKSAAVDGMEVTDEDGARLRWMDLNVSGRHWTTGTTAQMIRFTIISATATTASVTVNGSGCGGSVPDSATVTVHDAVGCFLNETAGDLVGRQGYAVKMKDGDDCRYEIISLCCP